MKNLKSLFPVFIVIIVFLGLAVASVTPTKTTYRKPVTYPCIHHAAITYSPILIKLNIGANYTMKDLPGVRSSDPDLIMEALHYYNSSYKIADGVTPNLVLNITYSNDGYDHFGVSLGVSYQGEGYFTITLQPNYVTIRQLVYDMAKELNTWVTQGWHEGNCN